MWGGGHGYREISVLPFQVFYNPKTALKKISLIKKKKEAHIVYAP